MVNFKKEISTLTTVEAIVAEYSSFDEFVDWVNTDIGIDKIKMLDTYLVAEKQFKDAGYSAHARVIKYRYNVVKDKIALKSA